MELYLSSIYWSYDRVDCFILGGIQFGLNFELPILLIFVSGQLFGYYLTPRFVGDAIKLNPIWIIFALSIDFLVYRSFNGYSFSCNY